MPENQLGFPIEFGHIPPPVMEPYKRAFHGAAILALALSARISDGQTFAETILLDGTLDGKPVRLFFVRVPRVAFSFCTG